MFKCVKITSFFALLFELLPDTTITVSGDFDFLRSWVNYKYRKKQKNKTKYFHITKTISKLQPHEGIMRTNGFVN